MRHEIKIGVDFAEAIMAGTKRFEVRRNDRGYQKGDEIVFRVTDRDWNPIDHPLNSEVWEITYVLNGWGLRDGFVAFGIVPAAVW